MLGGELCGDVHPKLGNPAGSVARENFRNIDIHANSSGVHEAFKANIPTFSGVARLVEREEGERLDKQNSTSCVKCLHVPFCWT